MTDATRPNGMPTAPTTLPEAAPLYLVSTIDMVDERIAGDHGCAYTSPAQPLRDALVLTRLLLGESIAPSDGRRWTRAVAIPGGRRTITLERAD